MAWNTGAGEHFPAQQLGAGTVTPGGDIAVRSVTVLPSSPYTASAPGGGFRLGNASGNLDLTNQPTLAQVRALQLIPGAGKAAGLVLMTDPALVSGVTSQILLYGLNDGAGNYDRFGISNTSGPNVVIDATYGGTGTPRSLTFQMGGSSATSTQTTIAAASDGVALPAGTITVASTAGFPTAGNLNIITADQGAQTVAYTGTTGTTFTGCTGGIGTLHTGQTVYLQFTGQNAVVIYADASVDLNGGTKTISGKQFGATRTRIADPMETGDTRLIIDTHTVSATNNPADDAVISFSRGGVRKWLEGLNAGGSATDSIDWYSTAQQMSLSLTGLLTIAGGLAVSTGGGTIKNSAAPMLSLQASSGAPGQLLRFLNPAASGHYNFAIGNQFNGTETFEITPSTAADGTSFTTPGFKMTQTGAITLGGTLNIGIRPAFVAADKYLVVDASGNVHVSALGPAS